MVKNVTDSNLNISLCGERMDVKRNILRGLFIVRNRKKKSNKKLKKKHTLAVRNAGNSCNLTLTANYSSKPWQIAP